MSNDRWTPNQVVAYNLRRARNLHGWTQDEAAAALEPYLGVRWSRVVFSSAERSTAGERIRQFSADELVAFAAAFELPISFFFLPPNDLEQVALRDAPEALASEDMLELATAQLEPAIGKLSGERLDEMKAMGGYVMGPGSVLPLDIRGRRS